MGTHLETSGDARLAALEQENRRLRQRIEALSGATAPSVESRLARLLGDRVVLANFPDFISILERDTRVVYLNRTIPGRSVDEMLGRLSTDHLIEAHRAPFLEAFDSAWTSGELRTLELTTVSGYHFASRFVPILEDGQTAFMLVTTTDVTENRRTELALRESEARMRNLQKMEAIGRLTAGVAHNFNNVLGIVLPNVDLARLGRIDQLGERLDAIEHAARRASDMVRDLMLFARGGRSAHRRPENPADLARRMLSVATAAFESNITLELEEPPAVPAVMIDAGQIEQVILNLLINARDALTEAATPDPRIVLSLSRDREGYVTVRVRDNGPGMDESVRAKIFEPFFTTKPPHLGTGLGLASAYAIVTDHGGCIGCETEVGVGTTLLVNLPIAACEHAERPTAAEPATTAGSEAILVVDDDFPIRRTIVSVLQHAGYSTAEAGDGLEGLAALDAPDARFDLVIVDGTMPRLSGFGFLDELAKRPTRPRTLFLSGNLDPDFRGADAALAKPLSMKELLRAVRSVLDDASRA